MWRRFLHAMLQLGISHSSTNQNDETSTMVGRWRANVILQRQMSKDSIFMHVWRLNLVWQERSINMAWRPRKNCFWNFVKVKSLTAGFILQLIKEQAQIVIRKVKVQTVLDQNLHSFYFTSYCWLWEIVTTEHLDPAAAAGEIRDGDGLAWCPWYRAMIPSACLLCISQAGPENCSFEYKY